MSYDIIYSSIKLLITVRSDHDEITPECIARTIQQAARQEFNVSSDFIDEYQLSRKVHVQQVKSLIAEQEIIGV